MIKRKTIAYCLLLLLMVIVLPGCNKEKRKANLSGIDFNMTLGRFDQAFWNLDTINMVNSLEQLNQEFPQMTDIYLQQVVQFGHRDSAQTHIIIKHFLADTTVSVLYNAALNKYSDVSDLNKQLTDAFRRSHYFFPELPIPKLYMHLSGFNQSVIVGEDFISLSADNYMGSDFELYKEAGIYDYQKLNMCREKIVSDFVAAYLLSEFPFQAKDFTLLEEIIYRGKIVYVQTVLMPKEPENVIMGYTNEQMQWAKANERAMWLTLVESKDLFTTVFIQKGRYLNDGPFTLPFTQESPSRGGVYLGWRIVEEFMKRNSKVTLQQLMELNNAQYILENSGYNP